MGQWIDQDGFAADIDEDLRAEARAERRRSRHWCDLCHGHTGPGSPCAVDEEPEEVEEEGDFCGGCNPEPTINELECGVCASCGKEL